jgi:hypothetical protein
MESTESADNRRKARFTLSLLFNPSCIRCLDRIGHKIGDLQNRAPEGFSLDAANDSTAYSFQGI